MTTEEDDPPPGVHSDVLGLDRVIELGPVVAFGRCQGRTATGGRSTAMVETISWARRAELSRWSNSQPNRHLFRPAPLSESCLAWW